MKLTTPVPQSLQKECQKAANIFKSFIDSGNNGLDGMIPRAVLDNAKGFAIFSVFKAGFVLSARAGSGIVIARLPDGSWSAPSAIGTAGLGLGGQLGAEITEFLIVLNSGSAITSFMSAGSLTLGGNASIALGPLGRNGEAAGSLSSKGKMAAMYSYSKTKGLFGGLSIEGSLIVERQDANALAYESDVTARQLLSGSIGVPPWAQGLVKTLDFCTGLPGGRKWIQDGQGERGYSFTGAGTPRQESPPSFLRKKSRDPTPSSRSGTGAKADSYFPAQSATTQVEDDIWDRPNSTPAHRQTPSFDTVFESDYSSNVPPARTSPTNRFRTFSSPKASPFFSSESPKAKAPPFFTSEPTGHAPSRSFSHSIPEQRPAPSRRTFSLSSSNRFSTHGGGGSLYDDLPEDDVFTDPQDRPQRRQSYFAPNPELSRPLAPHEGIARAMAVYPFLAKQAGDLSFNKGDIIIVTKKSQSVDDWWTGKHLDGTTGTFPANYVELM
ncbi:hypothetical protein BDV98DRAFT_564553 [Pterulicium gracile]|uniref:SH3 domain-containing protein n=1 Tax=Pterulicium gracile TaxID=1884261 RepID=A0A5C3QNU6_9AGAR|nr:hypothetical protein BDV98DRAFT_564553 [Pterula gracilis]